MFEESVLSEDIKVKIFEAETSALALEDAINKFLKAKPSELAPGKLVYSIQYQYSVSLNETTVEKSYSAAVIYKLAETKLD